VGFTALWDSLLPIGRYPPTGGYRRYSWTEADAACRAWFNDTAQKRGLRTSCDRNGNLWAWWDHPGSPRGAIVTGSHLDSVPDGGAYDGPLGVVSAFAAIDLLRAGGFVPARPIAVAAFCEEEGARFGLACLGTRLLTGAIAPEAARELRDGSGVSLAEAPEFIADPAGVAASAMSRVAAASGPVVVHFDVDVVDSGDLPLGNFPHYGSGVSLGDALAGLRAMRAHPSFAGLVLTEVNPTHDADGSQLGRYVRGLAGALAATEDNR